MTFLLRLLCVGVFVSAHPLLSFAAQKEWQVMKGGNFIIYYRQNVPEDFAQTVMDSAEAEFKRVTENLGITRYQSWAWDKRAAIYIYDDEEDYTKNGGQAGWSHGAALVGVKTIKTFPSAYGFFDSTLPHELGHIIFREFVGLLADAPLWFEEGVAMYQEKAKRLGANKIVKEAMKNDRFIPLSKLTNMRLYSNSDEHLVQLFYAESASLVYFMITQLGDVYFYKLCRELKQNTLFEEALDKVYARANNLKNLNKMWVQYLEDNP